MSSYIDASLTSGLVSSADLSGVLELKSGGVTKATVSSTGLALDTLTTTGNVGIGTSSPSQKLALYSSTSNSNVLETFNSPTGAGVVGVQTDNSFIINQQTANPLIFATANAEKMRIDSSGNVLINTSTTLAKLTTYSASGTIMVTQSGVTTGITQIAFANPNGYVGSITTSGSATAFNTSSDYRLKENVAPMTGALDKVAKLKPVTYTWKVDGSEGEGFIAHELQEVVPDCVTGEKDGVRIVDELDADGKKIGEKTEPVYQGIDTSFLVATLTAAIQEQQAIITDLKSRIETLEAK